MTKFHQNEKENSINLSKCINTDKGIIDVEESIIIANAKAGDNVAFDTLANRYISLIRWIMNGFNIPNSERDDLLQECYIGLLKAVRSYDNTTSSFATFATSCIKNSLITAINKYKKETDNLILIEKIPSINTPSPEQLIIDEESTRLLYNRFLGKLSDYEIKVFELYLCDTSLDEISKATSKSKKSINNAITRIKSKLEIMLESKYSDK